MNSSPNQSVVLKSWQCAESELGAMAVEFCQLLLPGDWVTLDGDLGAGKTTLVTMCGSILGANTKMVSPTFSLMSRTNLAVPVRKIIGILHLDLYRIKKNEEVCYLGLEQEFNVNQDIVFLEWADQVDALGWNTFFATTGCQRPRRSLHLEIRAHGVGREYLLYQGVSAS